jgi:chorismate mutase/prephenate dehydratase
MRNKPGALHDLLVPFRQANVDLTRVETRPSRSGRWTYVFFIDFLGHSETDDIQQVLQQVADQAADLKVLGSYPQAVL